MGNIPHDTEYGGAQSSSKILEARSFPLEDGMHFMHDAGNGLDGVSYSHLAAPLTWIIIGKVHLFSSPE